MNCKDADDLLIDYLYDELRPEQTEAVRGHLNVCPKCATRLAELSGIRELVGRFPEPEPTQIAINRILARAREEAEKTSPVWHFGWLKVLAPLCVVAIVTGVVAYQLRTGLVSWDLIPAPAREEHQKVLTQPAPPSEPLDRASLPAGPKPESSIAATPGLGLSPDEAPVSEKRMAKVSSTNQSGLQDAELEERVAEAGTKVPLYSAKRDFTKESREEEESPSTPETQYRPEPALAAADRLASPSTPAKSPAADKTADKAVVSKKVERLMQGVAATGELEGSPEQQGLSAELGLDTMARTGAYRGDEKSELALAAMLEEAEMALTSGKYKQASELFQEVLRRLSPGHADRPRSLLGLAQAEEGQGNMSQARRIYQDLATESPLHRDFARRKISQLSKEESE